MKILYKTENGFIFNTNASENLTDKENELISNNVWGVLIYNGELEDDIKKGNCKIVDGEIILKPEQEWIENITLGAE